MRVSIGTVEVSDDVRRAINAHFGRKGLATREEVRSYALRMFDAATEDLCYTLTQQEWYDGERGAQS